jgi:ATP-dependent Clp protease ATP-binding subunit ClpA
MADSTRTVYFTEPAKRAGVMALDEVSRLHHAYRGPEHYLLGLLRHADNQAARVLVAHGLDLETARAGSSG